MSFYSAPLPRYARPLFTLPKRINSFLFHNFAFLHSSVPLRYNSMCHISNLIHSLSSLCRSMPLLFRSHLCQSITARHQTLLLHSGSHLNYSMPLPCYAKHLFTLPMQTPLCQSMPFRYNSVYLISNLRFCFAYHNYIHPCRSLFGNFSPCVSAFP